MSKKQGLRRSGAAIMGRLILILGTLAPIMALAILNGAAGFLCAMGVTLAGAAAIAKALGEFIPLSYPALMGIAIGCGVLRGLLRYAEQYSNHYIAFRLLAALREKIFAALRLLCPAKLESKRKGAIIAMITSDIETLEVFYAHTVSPICIAVVVSGCVALFVGFVSNWWLALVAVAGYLTVGVLLPLVSSARLKASGVRYRSQFSSFSAYFLDSIKGIREIVLYGGIGRRQREIDRRSDLLLRESRRMKQDVSAASAATELTVSLFILLTLAVGVFLTMTGGLTIGRMLIGVTAVFGSFGPVIAISALPGNLTQTFAAGDRVLDLLEEQPAVRPVTGHDELGPIEQLTAKHLSFGYGRDDQLLSDLSLRAGRGEIVGIVGPSGCGKSTLLKLLLRFWEKQSGEIKYNNNEIDRINTESLLRRVTMVSQTTYLFDTTIEENLRIAKPDATRGELEDACRQASVHDFIMTLPDGYRTRVGALGSNLSAGERQRIGLARAFLRDSDFILLDEPTSNVDSINEGIILKALLAQKKKRGILLVSHRESTTAIADRVYRMEKGRLYG